MNFIEASYPLSPMQQGMLFHASFDGQSGYYIEQVVCHLHQKIDVSALIQSWKQVLEMHPILRTSFSFDKIDQLQQFVHDQVELPFIQQEWQNSTEAVRWNKLNDYLQHDRYRGFDIDRPPLMRLALFQQQEADYILVWTFHHALLDGRSISTVLQEVFELYDASLQNQIHTLPQRSPYKNYIDWLQEQSFEGAKTFWKIKLQGFTTPTQIPTMRGYSLSLSGGESLISRSNFDLNSNSKSSRQTVNKQYKSQKTQLTAELTAALTSLATEQKLTLNSLVQGAWALLLHRYSGDSDVVFGVTRACRYSSIEKVEEMVGLFINTLPIRTKVTNDTRLLPWLKELRTQWVALRDFEHTPLVKVQEWSDVKNGSSLFESVVVFDYSDLTESMESKGGNWIHRKCQLLEQTHYPLLLNGYGGKSLKLKITFDSFRFDDDMIARMLGQLEKLLREFVENPQRRLVDVPLLKDSEYHQLIFDWNNTKAEYPQDRCIHQLFEQQVTKNPDAIAISFEERQLTYRQLNEQANQLAHYLQLQGVGPDDLVGLHMKPSLEMMVGLLGIHKAGGAYLPLDPNFPQSRLTLMLGDSEASVILTQQQLIPNLLVESNIRILPIDTLREEIAQQPVTNPNSMVKPENLSYVIYTSGSTGKPKGVMVEHRNVSNFFTGMDSVIEPEPPGVWLAVTSLSFDISVLELLWTLARGFKVVIYNPEREQAQSSSHKFKFQNEEKAIDFSLFYFSSHEAGEDATDKYRLLLEGAKFGDAHGFQAIWTPERHFHAFGGLFPNPAVTSSALAAITEHIQIRAGSCVSPLHNPVRLTEDWSVVDNLSKGRVGISFAAGWQPNDFVLQPGNFHDRKAIMFDQIEEVQTLWRGESVTYPNDKGENVEVRTLPRPIQPQLPVWITAAGNPETFQMAGAKGFHILTHLLGQTLDELADKITIYRRAWIENGHSGEGIVTLMLHTFVGENDDTVRELVRQPMRHYLASSLNLIKLAAWSFPTFKQKTTDEMGQFSVSHLSEQEWDDVLDFSFERYFETSGLFGTVEKCLQKVDQIKGIGVNEIACLIDFGVNTDAVLAQLSLLHQVKERAHEQLTLTPEIQENSSSLADLIQQHEVTHLQCTPSMASILLSDTATREAMRQLRCMMLGGEPFSESLATQLRQIIPGQIHNMYGPTETTIWSATYKLDRVEGIVPIGRPIANTELYVLDKHLQPVPVGVPGELFIGGKGVTRGYLNRPELTQERFVPNPFNLSSGEYLYRTGDLVCYRQDGNLEFLGRADFQVKVRGYRIELGEIETILSRHETVKEAVTLVREDMPGDRRLVAYVLPQTRSQLSDTLLREYLGSQLPEYMVPSHFVILEVFPLTPNNKVDRKALPAPITIAHSEETSKEKAYTPIEETLIEIWQEVLQIRQLETGDNFFNLGGNSLIAVSLISKIRTTFNIDLPLLSLFRAPTIRAMAAQIEELLINQSTPHELELALKELEQSPDKNVFFYS